MRFTFTLEYHHNNPTRPVRFVINAKDEQEAYTKAIIWGLEHEYGTSYNFTPETFNALFDSDSEYRILEGHDEYDEETTVHFWRMRNERAQPGKEPGWNIGFGLGGEEENDTNKYENTWVTLVNKHPPKTKEEYIKAIEGMVYELNKMTRPQLDDIFNRMIRYARM